MTNKLPLSWRLLAGLLFASQPIFGLCQASDQSPEPMRRWGKICSGQALSIALDKAAYAPGEAIDLSIVFKNVGMVDLPLVKGNILDMVHISITNSTRAETPLTVEGERRKLRARDGSRRLGVIASREEIATSLELSELFDLSQPGTYTIVVSRWGWEKKEFGVRVVSNKLEFDIGEHDNRNRRE